MGEFHLVHVPVYLLECVFARIFECSKGMPNVL